MLTLVVEAELQDEDIELELLELLELLEIELLELLELFNELESDELELDEELFLEL